jgi:phosphate transport system substrate-binding protein
VREIAVNGHLPTRQNALDGDYSFLATEHLFTRGQPTGLAKDLIDFLTSPAENNQLRSTSFISCADLAASATLKDDCPSG